MHQTLVKLILHFEWDEGNLGKNERKHDVSPEEAEQIFVNSPLLILGDEQHSAKETRHQALGRSNEDRLLFISFTIREHRVRVISARPMSRAERTLYEEEKTETHS